MEADVYDTNGSVEKKMTLPQVFDGSYNRDIILRALLAEQSRGYQPQGHYVWAGMETSASYVGRLGNYRTQRHIGRPPRPRQKLAKGGQGDVRKIPSSVKGRRAHPHHVEKIIVEKINRKEYEKALSSAIASTGKADLIKQNHLYSKGSLPMVVDSGIEKITRTKDLLRVLKSLGVAEDVDRSHEPRTKEGRRRMVQRRYFRNSVLLVVKDASSIEKAGRNIPGVDVVSVNRMKIGVLAPGAKPRLTLWSESAVQSLAQGIAESSVAYKR